MCILREKRPSFTAIIILHIFILGVALNESDQRMAVRKSSQSRPVVAKSCSSHFSTFSRPPPWWRPQGQDFSNNRIRRGITTLSTDAQTSLPFNAWARGSNAAGIIFVAFRCYRLDRHLIWEVHSSNIIGVHSVSFDVEPSSATNFPSSFWLWSSIELAPAKTSFFYI